MDVVVLPEASTYRYWDQGSIAGNWTAPAYDDSAWPMGPAPLGYSDPYIATTVGYGPNAQAKYVTTWFRAAFNVQNAASITAATLELIIDDGAVVYLNGAEVNRTNMPAGAIDANTLANYLVQGGEEGQWNGSVLDPAVFVEGKNVIAIEMHQQVANTSDAGMDARITVTKK